MVDTKLQTDAVALEQLAADLGARGYETRLLMPPRRTPWLTVTNPQARRLTENVAAHAGAFWWSWAERIASADDVAGAADVVARVLAVSVSVE